MWRDAIFACLLLAGCAGGLPQAIREAPAEEIALAAALKNPEGWRGRAVRWGGAIASVENRQDETWLEVVEHPLYRGGEPRVTDLGSGRFLVQLKGFFDPAVYARDRLVTVAGALGGTITRKIGEHPYTYIVVRGAEIHLWPKTPREVHRHYYSPYPYDPWYPWGYPYRRYR